MKNDIAMLCYNTYVTKAVKSGGGTEKNKEVIEKYDHADLNNYFENPTAELMVKRIAVDIIAGLPKGVHLVSVKLWETQDSYSEWSVYDGCVEEFPLLKPGLLPAT